MCRVTIYFHREKINITAAPNCHTLQGVEKDIQWLLRPSAKQIPYYLYPYTLLATLLFLCSRLIAHSTKLEVNLRVFP